MTAERHARHEQSVAHLYTDHGVVETYLQQRFSLAWSRLLHQRQVAAINRVIRTVHPAQIIEIAPGPARLATDLRGVRKGLMLDASEPMLALARQRLAEAGLEAIWDVREHNAFDLESLQIPCDFLYSFRFIRHFDTPERARLYRAIQGVLHTDGLAMFDVVNRDVRQMLDAKSPEKPAGELDVFDATYSPEAFSQEMQAHGFSVVALTPVIRHFALQSWISAVLRARGPRAAHLAVNLLERVPSRAPLEWIALVKKIASCGHASPRG